MSSSVNWPKQLDIKSCNVLWFFAQPASLLVENFAGAQKSTGGDFMHWLSRDIWWLPQ